jgi:hypothetical protein
MDTIANVLGGYFHSEAATSMEFIGDIVSAGDPNGNILRRIELPRSRRRSAATGRDYSDGLAGFAILHKVRIPLDSIACSPMSERTGESAAVAEVAARATVGRRETFVVRCGAVDGSDRDGAPGSSYPTPSADGLEPDRPGTSMHPSSSFPRAHGGVR